MTVRVRPSDADARKRRERLTERDIMKIITTILATIVTIGILGVVYIYSGAYDVAASKPDNPLVNWVLETTRTQSIQAHAKASVPADFGGEAMVRAGAAIYSDDCAACHGAPGRKPSELSQGMTPSPPDLERVESTLTRPQLFWIVKHGIRMTGMPAWGRAHNDDELWDVVAFLRSLPVMTPEQYKRLQSTAPTTERGEEEKKRDR